MFRFFAIWLASMLSFSVVAWLTIGDDLTGALCSRDPGVIAILVAAWIAVGAALAWFLRAEGRPAPGRSKSTQPSSH